MRKVLFWIHLALGLAAGAVIVVMSVTGVLLTYEKQMLQWADRRAAGIEPLETRLPVSALLERADISEESATTSVTMRRHPAAPLEFAQGQGRLLQVNPYTGAAAGPGAQGLRQFFRKVTLWHRWLGSQAGARGWQRQVTGASNAIFCFLALSGLYMWWPRRWTPAARRTALVPQAGLSGKAREFNWHNAMGFWMAVPLIVITGSALVMSYSWANDLVYRLAGEQPPRRAVEGRSVPERAVPKRGINLAGLDQAVAHARRAIPGWQAITIRIGGERLVLQVDSGNGGQPHLRETLTFDGDGRLVERAGFEQQSAGRRARSWLRFLHTGEALGIAGQTLAGLASAVALVLVWSGTSLATRRLAAKLRARQAKPPAKLQANEHAESPDRSLTAA